MGRPTLPAELKRSHRVSASYTEAEFELINTLLDVSEQNDLARFVALASLGAQIKAAEIMPEINVEFLAELRLLREAAEAVECILDDTGATLHTADHIRQLTVGVQSLANFVTGSNNNRGIG